MKTRIYAAPVVKGLIVSKIHKSARSKPNVTNDVRRDECRPVPVMCTTKCMYIPVPAVSDHLTQPCVLIIINTEIAEICLYKKTDQRVFQIAIIVNVLVSSPPPPKFECYGSTAIYFDLSVRESTLYVRILTSAFRRQILMFQVDPRSERVTY